MVNADSEIKEMLAFGFAHPRDLGTRLMVEI